MEEHSGFFILPVLELLKRFAIIFAGLAILDFGLCYRSKGTCSLIFSHQASKHEEQVSHVLF